MRLNQISPTPLRAFFITGIFLVCTLLSGCEPSTEKPDAGSPDQKAPGQLLVAAAANMKFALDEIISVFQQEHPDLEIKVTYGSTGNFKSQIEQGAPFDLFLSADVKTPEKLVESGHAVKSSLFEYAAGRLVMWVRTDSNIDVTALQERTVLDPAVRKIALANPLHAPYGQAAVEALKHFHIYDEAEPRFVLGENIAQAAQFAETGAAEVGIIALSLAVAPSMQAQGRYWEVPAEAFQPILQAGVILSNAKNPSAAEELKAFIMSDRGTALLEQFGYLPPQEKN